MTVCCACSAPLVETAVFCSRCGAAVDASATPTGTAPRGPSAATPARLTAPPEGRSPAPSSSRAPRTPPGLATDGRFAPGTLLGERFRIVGLLGKGGMGEVYRADDLRLGQAVALKFLPEAVQGDTERLARLHTEVRLAREVSHPNVCRVHDVGELDGQTFLSMELVDGEDLSSLLRRIGRLPPDKAVEIARQLCAGLAAAHDKGVLHRDLKPANVMIDGRGRVRITDFGLATVAEAVTGADVLSGTPAYMSPEQLQGREVTQRSDVYALGLVLYELFTGRRAVEGRTLAEIKLKHYEETPRSPSELVPDLDPAVERAILRCLIKDPRLRPASALAVAASLPGGDPLAAALAAGETPSPELVAAAGEEGGLRPARALALVAFVVLAAVASVLASRELALFRVVPFEKPPAVLEDRAREILRSAGWTEPAADSALGFGTDVDYLQAVAARDQSPGRWAVLESGEPPAVFVWYREGPRPLVAAGASAPRWTNPPPLDSGMRGVRLDMRGRLLELQGVPPQVDRTPTPDAPAPVDWAPLFEAARLDLASLRPAASEWTPATHADNRQAWEGVWPGSKGVALRVEAASYRGRPVWFRLITPWTRPERMQALQLTRSQKGANVFGGVLVVCLLAVSALLARRNLRLGRVDRRGAARLALGALGAVLVAWALDAHHVADFTQELYVFLEGLQRGLLISSLIWAAYLALEPFVRRLWPDALVSWTRLLSGRAGDPLVGAHVLMGTGYGALMALTIAGTQSLARALGAPGGSPEAVRISALLGPAHTVAALALSLVDVALGAMAWVLLFVGLRSLLRRQALAALALVLLLGLQQALGSGAAFSVGLPLGMLVMAIPVIALARQGFLSLLVALLMVNLLVSLPVRPELGHWSAGPTYAAALVLLTVLGFAYWSATRGWRVAEPA
jgi:hypothetical protein